MQPLEVDDTAREAPSVPAVPWQRSSTVRSICLLTVTIGAACVIVHEMRPEDRSRLRSEGVSNLVSVLQSCETEREKVLKSGLVGAHVPQCEEDGSYSSVQCTGSTGFCRCSLESGEWIPGIETGPGSELKASICDDLRRGCSDLGQSQVSQPESKASCKEVLANQRAGRSLVGQFTPRCEEDGTYSPFQVYGSTGFSWCSTAAGDKVRGTEFAPSEPGYSKEDCVALRDMCMPTPSACQKAAAKAKRAGHSAPRCNSDGTIASK